MQLMKLIACVFVALTVSACVTPDPDVQVEMVDPTWNGTSQFKVDAIEEGVVIKKFLVDQGKCKSKEFEPITLPYGQSKHFVGMCSPGIVKEIEITTNRGAFSFNFK